MAMTLRPTEDQQARIAKAAEIEGKSMHQFILDAALDAAARRERRRDELLAQIIAEDAGALERLANA